MTAETGVGAAAGTAVPSEPLLPMNIERPDAKDSASSAIVVSCAASRRRSPPQSMSPGDAGRAHQGERKKCPEPDGTRRGGAKDERPSTWGARAASRQGQPRSKKHRQGGRGGKTRNQENGPQKSTEAREQETGTRQPGQKRSPRQGLEIQIERGREVSHGPARAYLPSTASPNLQGDA